MPENKIDSGLQDELLEALNEIKTSYDETKEELETKEERLAKIETENEELRKKVETIEKAEPIERKIQPVHWDVEQKEKFAKHYLAVLNRAQQKTTGVQAEETSTAGAELISDEYLPEIFRIVGEKSLAMQLARIIPMKGLTLKVPYAGTTAASVALTAEGTAATQSKVTFAQATLTADRLDAYSTVSNELLEDADVDVVDYLMELFGEAMEEKIDGYVFEGTGSPVSGLTTAKAGYSVVFDSGSLSWSQLKADYLSEMISKVKPSVLGGCVYISHPTATHYIRVLKDDNGQPIYQPPNAGAPGQIYGYPHYTTTLMSSTTTGINKPMVVFGNMKRGYLIGLRKRLEVESSRHLKILENQTVIVYRMRAAFCPILPNAFVRLITAAS
jgi:HK97 family phage major capsid protein